MDDEDEAALTIIRERYGCATATQAVRLALRVLAQSPHLAVAPPEHVRVPRNPQEVLPPSDPAT